MGVGWKTPLLFSFPKESVSFFPVSVASREFDHCTKREEKRPFLVKEKKGMSGLIDNFNDRCFMSYLAPWGLNDNIVLIIYEF